MELVLLRAPSKMEPGDHWGSGTHTHISWVESEHLITYYLKISIQNVLDIQCSRNSRYLSDPTLSNSWQYIPQGQIFLFLIRVNHNSCKKTLRNPSFAFVSSWHICLSEYSFSFIGNWVSLIIISKTPSKALFFVAQY